MTFDPLAPLDSANFDPATTAAGAALPVGAMTSNPLDTGLAAGTPIVCVSHLRWDFVFQRPQHLMSRLAQHHPVFYVEEPVPTDTVPFVEIRDVAPGVRVLVPRLPAGECRPGDRLGEARQRVLLGQSLDRLGVMRPLLWYYTPMGLGVTGMIDARLVVYDCMDELAAFDNPPADLVAREQRLLESADLVFTGGHSLYESKRRHHPRVYPFPSSVDAAHFRRARERLHEPADMRGLRRPRIGFYGVVDERFDRQLLGACARLRPEWEWIVLGPVVKIDPATLPRASNLHYPGMRTYAELPDYLGAWDVAMMPFAINASTRYISPTKTPEYLAAGCPVVSTPVPDVARAYGHTGLVHIAVDAPAFVAAVALALEDAGANRATFCARADALLDGMSWDRTVDEMTALATSLPARRVYAGRRGPQAASNRLEHPREPVAAGRAPAR